MKRIAARTTALALALTSVVGIALAARYEVSVDRIPGWVREAASQTAPPTGADAVLLLQENIVEPLSKGGVRYTRRFAARVLAPEAVDWLRHLCEEFYKKDDGAPELSVWTLPGNGTALEPNKRDDAVDMPAVDAGFTDFTDWRSHVLWPVAPSPGAVVAFESVKIVQLDSGAGEFLLGDSDHPTLLSRVVLRVPEGWSGEGFVSGAAAVEKEQAPGRLTFTARDLYARPPLELRPRDREFLTRAAVRWFNPDGSRGFKDWNAVARFIIGLHAKPGQNLGAATEVSKKLQAREGEGVFDALDRAFSVAARDTRYVAIELGIGGLQPHAPGDVLRTRYGDCKDKAFLLQALVAPWGLRAHPVLVRTRDRGLLEPDAPGLDWFNHMITAIELPAGLPSPSWNVLDVEGVGRLLIVDPTTEDDDIRDLRADDQDAQALLVMPDRGILVRLPVQPATADQWERSVTLAVDPTGALSSAVIIDHLDAAAAESARREWTRLSLPQRKERLVEEMTQAFPGTTIVEETFTGLDRYSAPLERTVRLRGGRAGQWAGSMLVLEAGRAVKSTMRPTLPPPPYQWALDVGEPRREIATIDVTLPERWGPESLPRAVALDLPELAIDASWSAPAPGRLVYHRVLEWRTMWIKPERYAAFRDAMKTLDRSDRAAVVLVRSPD